MEITFIGIVVIILSIFAFIRDEDWLLGLVIFFSIFNAAEALNIHVTTTAIIPFEIPLVLWILKQVIEFIKNKHKISKETIKNTLKHNKIFTALLIFTIIIIISEFWLFISRINYSYYDSLYLEDRVINFSGTNISQPARIIIYLVFVMILSLTINSKEKIKKLLKIFSISTIFAIVWGFIQFLLYYLGINYPAYLFNNNPYYAQCYDQVMHGIKRISSIATEPSVFALNLLAFIPIILVPWIFETKIADKRSEVILTVMVAISFLCTILTTSSTAIVGLIVTIIALFAYLIITYIKYKQSRRKCIMIMKKLIGYGILTSLIAIFICISANTLVKISNTIIVGDVNNDNSIEIENQTSEKEEMNFIETIKEMTISKLSSHSGQERLTREILGLKIYLNSPIFGVGIGSFRTFSMISNILVNMGIVGLVSYIYILFIVVKTIIINSKKDIMYSLIFLLSILGMTVAFLISIPDLIYIYYWIILVLGYKYFSLEED